MKQQTRGSLMLLLCAMVWGAAFVAQSEGMNYVGPFTMQATRYFLSGLVLLPVIALRDKKGISVRPAGKAAKRQLLCGVICGALLCTASIIQQYGIIHTTVGKSGFITTMYIILVPFLGLFVKLRVKLMNWVCAVLALVGLYLLCAGGEGLSAVNTGDWLTLLCAVFFACHILFIDRACHDLDGVRLSCVQFFTASALSILPMLLLEKPSLAAVTSAWLPIVYAGVFSGGVGYTLQILGQQLVAPTLASMILSLESVFATISGALLLGDRMSGREYLGCALMFAAVVLAQLPARRKESRLAA